MTRTALWRSVLSAVALPCVTGATLLSPPKVAPTYEKDVLPLFQSKCLGCHGAGTASAGLDLRTRDGLRKVVDTIVPEKSKLLAVLASGAMPPGPQKLTAAELGKVRAWIVSGAKGAAAPVHWAFRPPIRPTVPGSGSPIDALVQAKGRRLGPEADRRTLIRRVTFDLIGVPPTPEEVDTFVADTRPDAYEKVVDRLLADPRYGEHWARPWLDLAGYADSEGVLQEDRIRPNAWRFRDWVIRSLNADKPYDRFLKEQIAGDELSGYRTAKAWTPEIEEQVVATGFLRTAVDATRDDFNEHQFTEYQYRMLHDTETILVSATMAVTIQCARCHDHKYEPISQKDYYRIQADLAGAIRPRGPLLPTYRRQIVAATAEEQKRAEQVNAAVDTALEALKKREEGLPRDAKAQRDAIAAERRAEERKRVVLTELRALYDQDATPPPTPLLHRGELDKPRETIEPGVPAVLDDPKRPFVAPSPAPGSATTGRRTALANWIASPDNPLTARAIVNRLWARHFGVGIVATTENLGRSGAAPSNQPLLDWLATELVAQGWRLKPVHRQLVLSRTYRQAGAPRRLEAEALRDGILSVAGNLDPTLYGEPVGLEVSAAGEVTVAGETGKGRRSIYVQVRRTQPVTFLNAFDAPVMETNCTRRAVSATPTQALTLLNSRFLAAQSAAFARRLQDEVARTAPRSEYAARLATVERAYRLAYQRTPSPDERRAAVGFLQTQAGRYPADGDSHALADFCSALLSANEFLYVD